MSLRRNVDDEDLERMQEEFFAGNQTPAAKVIRQSAPTVDKQKKKRSLFAERLAAQTKTSTQSTPMPALEKADMPALENADMPVLENADMPALEGAHMPALENTPIGNDTATRVTETEDEVVYEPVMDPHPEPHVPVTKKMIDLTSLLGQVLGDIKEHTADHVEAPSLPDIVEGRAARGQKNGFPKAVHRSEFKKRLEAQKQIRKVRQETPPAVVSSDENSERIENMSPEELEAARSEIMNSLSKESIAFLMKGKGMTENELAENTGKGKASEPKETVEDEERALMEMKTTYFADVPLEEDKLAWILKKENTDKVEPIDDALEKEYRQTRFDLQGKKIDVHADIPRHKGLHHHGDEPDKAGYSLAELFLLTRSQMPSQRAMVLNVIGRIIQHNPQLKSLFLHPRIAATVYLRSALDDRHLVVQIAAIHALSALMSCHIDMEAEVMDVDMFNTFLGHVVRKKVKSDRVHRKGLNEKIAEWVESPKREYTEDVSLVQRDVVRGLIQMDLLPRLRYLVDPQSELLQDRVSMEFIIEMLIFMAKEGQDVCEVIGDEDLIDPLIQWGLSDPAWPMLEEEDYPSLGVVRLLTVLCQGSKRVAESVVEKARITLQFLVTSPEIACLSLKPKAYALQVETLKWLRILASYGCIIPTLIKDLHATLLDWLFQLNSNSDVWRLKRAATALHLLEVLLSAAADPHKTVPEHAIDWNEASAYVPAVMALFRESQADRVYESALGYLGTWASYHNLFPPSPEMAEAVFRAVNTMDHRRTSHCVLRYIQFTTAYRQQVKMSDSEIQMMKKDIPGRYGLWLARHDWKPTQEDLLVCGVAGSKNILERWVSKCFIDTWMKQVLPDDVLVPFYTDGLKEDSVSRALYHYDGRGVQTFIYDEDETSLVSEFILSPIDALYHWDKSLVAQKSPDKGSDIVQRTLEVAYSTQVDHDAMVIALMKIFLIGDREGQVKLSEEKEIFWDVSDAIERGLDSVCKTKTDLSGLERAWIHSSDYIQQNQVPFYQFYQGFVSQYASVSFGHHGFARLLVYLVTQIDTIDYRHLVFVDYKDVLATIKVRQSELPPLTQPDRDLLKQVGICLQ